ncbi:MAG: HAD hydrolase family protein [Candidatus Latescibacteria bacterium]|nr:HAD hydrolase family protein [Candidatus Latescibacterota bacterium]
MAASTLYVTDLDGTLLRNDTSLSEYSTETLNSLLEQGLLFTAASARSVYTMRHMLAALNLSLPVVEFNGAFVTDLASGRHHLVHNIQPGLLPDLWQQITASGHIPCISAYDGTADRLYYRDITNDGMAWYIGDRQTHHDERLRYLADLQTGLNDQVVCLTVIGLAPELAALDSQINQRYTDQIQTHCYENQYSPGWHWLTIHDIRATKDQGIRSLQRLQGLEDSRLVVFGDQVNDLDMFRLADEAYAVANAIPALKEEASGIIDSNEEDGVARYIQTHWQGAPN